MSRSIDLTKDVEKFISRLDDKRRRQVMTRIASLRECPVPQDSCHLANFLPITRRIDVGEYRIAYRFDNQFVQILIVGKRNDDAIYRKLKRIA